MAVGVGHVVIAGAGVCGGRAAEALREAGHTGAVTLIGDEGHGPYERPPLSKAALTGADEPAPVAMYGEGRLAELDIDLLTDATVSTIDRDRRVVELAGGQTVPYDRLLLATGARPRPLTVPGGEAAVLLRTFGDALRLRSLLGPDAAVVVIGGGFIGLEVAASARRLGAEVTVVELAPAVMSRVVPAPLASAMAGRHDAAGVRLRCGVGVERMEPSGTGHAGRVVLADGTALEADVVVAGVGALPNVELAQRAGLAIGNGVSVDGCLETSDPAIFAAGDCCSFPHPLAGGSPVRLEAWRNALDQAEVAARNLLGAGEPYERVPWFWTDQYELTLYLAGLPHMATTTVLRPRADGVTLHFGLAADGRLVAAGGVAEGTAVAKDIRLAELLIAKQVRPDPAALADPTVPLKALART